MSSAGRVNGGKYEFDIPLVTLGNPDPVLPAIGFFGGVHGLERIGSQVVIAFLHSLVMRLQWDVLLRQQLQKMRMVFMPIVNPGGMWRGTRANPQGVDLMRNAPVHAQNGAAWWVGGQRYSRHLPWYQGALGEPMQTEAQALCEVVRSQLLTHSFSITLDCHSGFGLTDRIWFPFANCARPMAHLPEVHALSAILDQSQAQHQYVMEPQSRQYRTHGDLWDYLYTPHNSASEQVFLPLTLEMGSWLWVKKNPRQLLSKQGIFNPLITHRHNRVLRRHLVLLDFLTRAAFSHEEWLPQPTQRQDHYEQAAYFSDRGRLFQIDRGRRFSVIADESRVRASRVGNIAQSSTINLKQAVQRSWM